MFVVGETPTGGIDRAQFHNAREYIKHLHTLEKSLLILGPQFSGSFRSLAELLKEDPLSDYCNSRDRNQRPGPKRSSRPSTKNGLP